MVSKKKKVADQKEEEDGEGGKGGTGVVPTFNELMVAVSPEESELTRCAQDALFKNRVSLKAQGEKVDALDKKQELRKKMADPRFAAELDGGGGSGLEAHPELPELGGAFDNIVFPEVEAEAAARNDPQLKNELKNRLGMGMSVEAIKYDLENKEKLRARPAPAPEPRPEYDFRPAAPPPKPRPPGF